VAGYKTRPSIYFPAICTTSQIIGGSQAIFFKHKSLQMNHNYKNKIRVWF